MNVDVLCGIAPPNTCIIMMCHYSTFSLQLVIESLNLVAEVFNSFTETHDKISFSQQERDRLKRTVFEVQTTKRHRELQNVQHPPHKDPPFSQFQAFATVSPCEILIKPIYFPSKSFENVCSLIKRLISSIL